MAGNGNLRWIEAYDCNDLQREQRPDLVPYQPVFKKLNDRIREAVDLLRNPVLKSQFKNVMTKSLLDETQFRTAERSSAEVMFAVVGDMASGKSSLINSILGIGMIARKGNSGSSCTWVVQRFMRMFDDQYSPFAAKVYFFNSDEIKGILKSLIARYYRAMGKGASSDDEDEGEDDQEEDISEKHTVLEAMMPLFCDQEEFETVESAMRFLNKAESEDDEVMLEQLATWADDVKDGHLKSNDFVTVIGSTADELIGRLQPYSCTVESEFGRGRTQPWPLIRMIDFGLNIPILNDGVILVDSPGISDANSIRAANAKSHHAKCSHKIHVAKVGRARDDKSLRDAMADTYKWRGTQNSILVLTYGEEIDRETEVYGSDLAKKMERQLKGEIDNLSLRKEKLVSNMRMACEQERWAINNELDAIRPNLRQLQQEFDACRLKMRNEHTKLSIQQNYKQLTGDKRPLPIYVVGNDSYNAHSTGHYEDEKPILTVEETGLPALRTKLYAMPADGKLNDSLHLAQHQLPRLITSFEMFCSRMYISRKSEIEDYILQPAKQWPEIQQRTVERLKEEVRRIILQPMKEDEDQWIRKARRFCKDWGVKYYKKDLQLLKNDGFQAGRKKNDRDICWNSDLLNINKDDIEETFKELALALRPCYDEMWKEVTREMETAKKNIRNDKEFNLMALSHLIKTFNNERPAAGLLVNRNLRNLRNGAIEILEETVRGPRSGYLAKAMLPVYADVRKMSGGTGAIKRRVQEFERQVCKRSGVLMQVHDTIEDAFDKLFQKQLTDLGKLFEGVFDGINKSFRLMCDDVVAKTDIQKQQEAALITRLNKALVKARELADGPIKELAVECKNYSAAKEETSLFVSKG